MTLLDLQFLGFLKNLVHKILLHEVEIDGDEQEMWFLIIETPMRFSRIEFTLITGLTFGPYPEVSVDSHRLQDLYFGLKPTPSLDDIDSAFYALDFTVIDDMDAVKITLYYVLEQSTAPSSFAHTEYRDELFGDDPDDRATDTHVDPPP
ncbi:Ulp1 protease family, C-terminal catalytic domain containing protein [Melia azedarach]|uniref:Ulp1 protease family, C-terminal catalytic domain containing protein n=1 Tax=Melia azedarach TaxID=155640 RepID=A0ACC1YBL2_MELAZ|nr:Ulp1 protease family, C-terminal catalytic domain containing protein [Melia azedarach]